MGNVTNNKCMRTGTYQGCHFHTLVNTVGKCYHIYAPNDNWCMVNRNQLKKNQLKEKQVKKKWVKKKPLKLKWVKKKQRKR